MSTTFADVVPVRQLTSHSYAVDLADEWCIGNGELRAQSPNTRSRSLGFFVVTGALTCESHSSQWRVYYLVFSARRSDPHVQDPRLAICTTPDQRPS